MITIKANNSRTLTVSSMDLCVKRGFALIATISIMVLLVMVALAMLSLSAIELRSSQNGQAMAEARANARLSLMLAIGQLQKEMGPDQRISAPADILVSNSSSSGGLTNAHYAGVWNSRQDIDNSGNIVLPPDYDKDSSFRTWLVSKGEDLGKNDALTTDYTSSGITLLGAGTSSDNSDWVDVPRVEMSRGSLGWWVSDNGAKQRINAGHQEDETELAPLLASAHSASGGSDGQHVFDEDLPDQQEDWQRLITLDTLGLTTTGNGSGQQIGEKYHDVTTTGASLLVDVSRGGLRKCMNLALESATTPPEYTLQSEIPWEYIRHYNNLYRLDYQGGQIASMSAGRPLVKAGSDQKPSDLNGNPLSEAKRLRLKPVMVKFSMIGSYATQKHQVEGVNYYGLHFYFYPIVVLWNPYNVDLEVDTFSVNSQKLPLEFDVMVNGSTEYKFDWRAKSANAWYAGAKSEGDSAEALNENATIPAGGNLVLYYNSREIAPTSEHYLGKMARKDFDYSPQLPGVSYRNLRSDARHLYASSGSFQREILGKGSDRVKVVIKADVTDQSSGGFKRQNGWDVHLENYYMNRAGWGRRSTPFKNKQSASFLMQSSSPNVSFVSETEAPEYSMSSLENNPTPFMLFEYETKPGDEPNFPHKHWVHSLPAHLFDSVTRTDWGADSVTPWHTSSVSLKVESVSSIVDVFTRLNLSPKSQNKAYHGPSYGSSEGQLNVISQAIPLAPIHSLGQLQHLPVYNTSEYAERAQQVGQNHAIGNSFASPGIPSESITYQGWQHWWTGMGYGGGHSLKQRDHTRKDYSYIANARLFDAWFCSSIAHQDSSVNVDEGNERSLQQVARDFFEDGTVLPNSRYAAASGVSGQSAMTDLFSGANTKPDAYKKIAAHLKVEGGFNVNSTSVEAWTLLLANLHRRQVAALPSGKAMTTKDGNTERFVVSRFPLSSGETYDGSGNTPEAWNGVRELNSDDIEQLAESIVTQVKRYGPFRSLSEFVNRRLSYSDSDMALRGALAEAIESNPTLNKGLQKFGEITNKDINNCKYPFKEAALGPRLQGAPGYVTQADLLQSLAPVINVRSDSFTIRTCGEAKNVKGDVIARAWCEATVQREASYVDSADEAWVIPADITKPVNTTFGRRFVITGFRWLSQSEI